jgi:hypothetical protein
MAGWIYRPDHKNGGCVIEPVAGQHWKYLIAKDVSPKHGPLIALAPRMEAVIRSLYRSGGRLSPCCCDLCEEGRSVLREIDAVKGVSNAQD